MCGIDSMILKDSYWIGKTGVWHRSNGGDNDRWVGNRLF